MCGFVFYDWARLGTSKRAGWYWLKSVLLVRHFYAFCRNIFRKERVDQELEEEIRRYLELVAAEKVRSGMSREEAMREARRDPGGLEQVKESVRDIRIGVSMDTLMQDLRYAIRALSKNLAFSVVVVLTLALGIGANTTMFTVVNGVLLKPLPYREPDRLLMLFERQLSDDTLGNVAPANFFDWREQSRYLLARIIKCRFSFAFDFVEEAICRVQQAFDRSAIPGINRNTYANR